MGHRPFGRNLNADEKVEKDISGGSGVDWKEGTRADIYTNRLFVSFCFDVALADVGGTDSLALSAEHATAFSTAPN